LNLLAKVADNVTCGEVLADIVGCSVGEDAVTSLDGTSNLSGLLPDNLGEMRRLRVTRIVIRNFISPVLDSLLDRIGSRSSSQILTNSTKLASRMLKDTIVGPFLSFALEIITP
jgi:hypothetical protein